jgi:uroporphyrin-III C-methyltransferase/precorrin-2 dehydrogenase/sirohydrochlorin ferrochelatase
MTQLFPIFLKLTGRTVLVVGGGPVATSKIDALKATGARIVVVAPDVTEAIRGAGVVVRQRKFRATDLNGVWLVVSAATPAVNRAVGRAAARRRIFVNAVDDPPNATAYLGGVLRRSDVTMAISTSGRAPALAGLLREGLDAMLPADLDAWFQTADRLKKKWRSEGVPMAERRPELLDALINLYASRAASPARPGSVALVGAGPGDPGLLTARAIERLEQADVVFYDGLVPAALVDRATHAERISVARRAGPKALTQTEVSDRMIAAARAGRRVVRLKAGDPFVLGRGGEEMLALAEAGVPCEIVPGLSSALAGPAVAGIPVTHRGMQSAVVISSGHATDAYGRLLRALPPRSATLVVLMGFAERAGITAALVEAGWPTSTPVAVIANASRPDQAMWTGTLDALAGSIDLGEPDDPGVLIVIGDVVRLRKRRRSVMELQPSTSSY